MKKKTDERAEQCAEFYGALIEALRHVAYRCGYALAVHGSLKRDIDLIACPWRQSAVSACYLIDSLAKATEAIVGMARVRDVDKDRQPEKKPCGRLAWSFYLTHRDDMAYLDISVMPKGDAEDSAE
jgi:hypothetical protein